MPVWVNFKPFPRNVSEREPFLFGFLKFYSLSRTHVNSADRRAWLARNPTRRRQYQAHWYYPIVHGRRCRKTGTCRSVLDHGRGLTEEQIAKIGAFYQFERKQYEQQGLGLGLKIVKRIVEMNAGHFSVSSVYNLETKVHIQLPLIN